MNELHFKYWTPNDRIAVGKARTFTDLATIALAILARMQCEIQMVSGPISTGGVGSIEGNRKVFEGIIEILVTDFNVNIFSQMPFEDKMVELYRVWHAEHPHEKYCLPILNDFYEPIFLSGMIIALNFIHDWESSFGARWEHENCPRWNLTRKYLGGELSCRALAS
jgi:hypothetical protein